MTQEQYEEITGYFKDRQLPKSFQFPDGLVNDCATFVSTSIHRMEQGAPIVQETSYNALVRFRQLLETPQ